MASRPIDITVVNNTDVTVQFGNAHAQHGTTPVICNGGGTLPPGAQGTVCAHENDPIFGPGPEGYFSFTFQDNTDRAFIFDYNHPMGTGETYVNVTDPSEYTDKMTVNHLAHHDAYCTIELLILGD